eukprot:11619605-Ditylum_brightwellii.AAC.1
MLDPTDHTGGEGTLQPDEETAEMDKTLERAIAAYEGAVKEAEVKVGGEEQTKPEGEGAPTVTIAVPRKVYRPKPTSAYREPNLGEDLLDGVWVQGDLGKSLKEDVRELQPRDDVAEFDTANDAAELERGLQLSGCPEELHGDIKEMVVKYWDVFCGEGLRKPIRGFSFQVDTGNSKPVCCKPPRYGHHESKVMRQLIGKLDDNG